MFLHLCNHIEDLCNFTHIFSYNYQHSWHLGILSGKFLLYFMQKALAIAMDKASSIYYSIQKNLDTEKALQGLKKNTKAGSIIVFHDSVKSEKNLKAMLPLYLQFLNEKGFNCKAL